MRRDIVLDFTALLDVIMIILFMVILGANQTTAGANEAAEAAREEMLAVKQEYSVLQGEYGDLYDAYGNLTDAYAELTEDYSDLDALVHGGEEEIGRQYRALAGRTAKIELVFDAQIPEQGDNTEVVIDAYLDEDNTGGRVSSNVGTLKIVHNFTLSRDRRDAFNAEQVNTMTEVIRSMAETTDCESVWFVLMYRYDDPNISSLDQAMVMQAIDNAQLTTDRYLFYSRIAIR